MTRIAQLVPRLPPPICGVGDYALSLARELEVSHHFETVFFTNYAEASTISVSDLLQQLRSTLLDHLSVQHSAFLIVQYSGYGFAKRGAPIRLVERLRSLKKAIPSLKLITMFHELFASGAPTSSSFWLSPLQKYTAASLAKFSTGIVTNREASATWLKKRVKAHVPVHSYPVFSNFGEPQSSLTSHQRRPQIVIFGRREGLGSPMWESLSTCLTNFCVQRIVVVSQKMDVPASIRSLFSVEERGVLPPGEMSQLLSESRFGFLDYNPDFLGKSGVLAAFAAHGVIPLLARGKGLLNEGLQEEVHYINAQHRECDNSKSTDLELLQSALGTWYAAHALKPTATQFAELMK